MIRRRRWIPARLAALALGAPPGAAAASGDTISLSATPDPTALFEPTTVSASGTATQMSYVELATQGAGVGACPTSPPDTTFDNLSVNPGPYSVSASTTLPAGAQLICAWGFDDSGDVVATASLPIEGGADSGSVSIDAPTKVRGKQRLAITVHWRSNFAGYLFLDSRLSARGGCARAPAEEPSAPPELYFLSGNGNLNPADANEDFFSPWDSITSPGGQITYTSSKFDAAKILAGASSGGDGTYRLCAWLANAADGNTDDPNSPVDVVSGPTTSTIVLTGAGPGLLFPRIYGSYYWYESAAGRLTLTISVSGKATVVAKLYHSSASGTRLGRHIETRAFHAHRGVNRLSWHYQLVPGLRYAVVLRTRVGSLSAPAPYTILLGLT